MKKITSFLFALLAFIIPIEWLSANDLKEFGNTCISLFSGLVKTIIQSIANHSAKAQLNENIF